MNISGQVQKNPGFDSAHPAGEWPIIVFVKHPSKAQMGSWLYARDVGEAMQHVAALQTEAAARRDVLDIAWLDRLKPAA